MLKKIINILFIVAITVTPVLTIAADTTSEVKNTESRIDKSIFKENTKIQLAKAELEVVRTTSHKEAVKTEPPAPVNGWLLFSALIGFVLLCNRWTV